MADLSPTAASVRDASPTESVKFSLKAGVDVDAGEAVYVVAATGLLALADASAAGTAVAVGIALESVKAGQMCPVLAQGWLDGMGVSGVNYGVLLLVSDTAGAVDNGAGSPTVTAPIGRVMPAPDGSLTKLVYVHALYNLALLPA